MDAQGPDVARRFTEAARVTFPTAVDRSQGLWELYEFKVIPNGFFIDERGILRYAKIGGFDVRGPADRQAIELLLATPTVNGIGEEPTFATVTQALREAEEAARQNPQDLDVQLTLAERLEAAKQYDRSRRTFEAVLDRNGKSVRALIGLASVELGWENARRLCWRSRKRGRLSRTIGSSASKSGRLNIQTSSTPLSTRNGSERKLRKRMRASKSHSVSPYAVAMAPCYPRSALGVVGGSFYRSLKQPICDQRVSSSEEIRHFRIC